MSQGVSEFKLPDIGEGVHEGVQRAARHHEKRVAHRIAPAAAQRRVFEDVRNAGRILRHGQEGDEERLVRIVAREVHVPGAGGAVTVFLQFELQRGDGSTAQVFEGGMAHRASREFDSGAG